MDTIDRSDSNLPAELPEVLPRLPAVASAASRDLAPLPLHPINPRIILRGLLARYWWRILLLWLVVSAPVAYLIYQLIEPTYEAFSTLRIEPNQPEVYGKI